MPSSKTERHCGGDNTSSRALCRQAAWITSSIKLNFSDAIALHQLSAFKLQKKPRRRSRGQKKKISGFSRQNSGPWDLGWFGPRPLTLAHLSYPWLSLLTEETSFARSPRLTCRPCRMGVRWLT
jgi:hypothetical protein